MEEYKVLITTSGIGSRLGHLTEYTNKGLVRVSDKPAISHIIESYPSDIEFVITLGHFGSHVKQFLKIGYPNYKFTFVDVDNYDGAGSSLGHSIYQARHELQCPFIFHASDTILLNNTSNGISNNYVIGCHRDNSSQYRTLNITSNGKLEFINEKGEIDFDLCYIGVAGIHSYNLFFSKLKELLESGHSDTSDVHVINNMLEDVSFSCTKVSDEFWFDVGNTTELTRTRKSFGNATIILDKKDESIFFVNGNVIKFFADKNITINRVNRAKLLHKVVPEILDFSDNFYKYEMVDGNLFSKTVNLSKFKSLLEWSKKNLWVTIPGLDIEDVCYRFYIDKTLSRINKYLNGSKDIIANINGIDVPPFAELFEKIDKSWLCDGEISQIHGDFILDNIIETKDGYKLIDWRQDFGGVFTFGDIYYDLAKLNHNLTINHSIVNQNLFNPSLENCSILTSSILTECKIFLKKFIEDNGYDYKKVEVITSLIWINMAPLHEHPFNKFLFNFGKYNLYRNLQ